MGKKWGAIGGTVLLAVVVIYSAAFAGAVRSAPVERPLQALIGTSFSYQGYLEDGGAPANGTYDMRFSLWDAAALGNQFGSDETLNDVAVTDGFFTVALDFADVFDGTALWLQIEIMGSGDPGYTTLLPLQALSPVPYAINADKVDDFDVGVNSSYLAIPASAFGPMQFDTEYDNGGDRLIVYDYGLGSNFTAPVNLPHGAVVTAVTFYFNDTDPAAYSADPLLSGDARLTLFRVTASDNSRDSMAEMYSSGSSGHGSSTDASIDHPAIDNGSYFYYVRALMPFASTPFTETVELNAVIIEFSHVQFE